jgi:adenylate cyclase
MTEATHRANPPPVDRLSTIWRRAREHKVVQWVVAYIAVAYGLQHGVILASESLQWPNAAARISILLLVLGLPPVITFAWYHGARASRNFSQAEPSILSALLVIASLLFYVFVRPAETGAPALSQQASVTAARTAAADPHSAISLAVLPFVNLSSDKEQEFFSDGMTEEITAALAKVPDLRVVGRTSAFQFKGRTRICAPLARRLPRLT